MGRPSAMGRYCKQRSTRSTVFDHRGTTNVGTPALFGMNFQTVSTAEKLPTSGGQPGSYLSDGVTPQPGARHRVGFHQHRSCRDANRYPHPKTGPQHRDHTCPPNTASHQWNHRRSCASRTRRSWRRWTRRGMPPTTSPTVSSPSQPTSSVSPNTVSSTPAAQAKSPSTRRRSTRPQRSPRRLRRLGRTPHEIIGNGRNDTDRADHPETPLPQPEPPASRPDRTHRHARPRLNRLTLRCRHAAKCFMPASPAPAADVRFVACIDRRPSGASGSDRPGDALRGRELLLGADECTYRLGDTETRRAPLRDRNEFDAGIRQADGHPLRQVRRHPSRCSSLGV